MVELKREKLIMGRKAEFEGEPAPLADSSELVLPDAAPRLPAGVVADIDKSALISGGTRFIGSGRLVVGPHAVVEDNVLLDFGASGSGVILIGSRSKLKWGVCIRCYNGRAVIGHRTSIGEYTVIAAHGGVDIGAHVAVGPHCSITASEHIPDGSVQIRYQGERTDGIAIADDVWIAAGVHVLDGVSIGRHCVIGAGAVVTRPMPPDRICVGVPCRPVKDLADPENNPWRYERRGF